MKNNEHEAIEENQEQYLKDLTSLFEFNPSIGSLMNNYLVRRYGSLAVLTPEGMAHEYDYLKSKGDLHVVIDLALEDFGEKAKNKTRKS